MNVDREGLPDQVPHQASVLTKLVLLGPDRVEVLPLPPGELVTIGRDRQSSIVLRGHDVSPCHCMLMPYAEQGLELVDLESSSGTQLNGRWIDRALLAPFDQLKIGEFTLLLLGAETDAHKATSMLSPLGATHQIRNWTRRDRLLWLVMMCQTHPHHESTRELLQTMLDEIASVFRCRGAVLVVGEETPSRWTPLVSSRGGSRPTTWNETLTRVVSRLVEEALESGCIVQNEAQSSPGVLACIPVQSRLWQGPERRKHSSARPVGALLLTLGPTSLALASFEKQMLLALSRQMAAMLSAAQLDREAATDTLTGLLTRGSLERGLHRALSQARAKRRPLGLVLLDLGDLERIDDTRGRQAGDEVLRAVGRHLGAALRQDDLAGRWGGEKLVAVLPGADVDGTLTVAENVLRRVRAAALVDEPVTLSAGVAVYPEHAGDLEGLLQLADQALCAAKRAGKDRARVWSAELRGAEEDSVPSPGFDREGSTRSTSSDVSPVAWLLCDLLPVVPLYVGDWSLGRNGRCDVVLLHPTVSRLHAVIRARSTGELTFEDGSTNGSWVNGLQVQHRVALNDGDQLRVGSFVLRVRRSAQVEPHETSRAPPTVTAPPGDEPCARVHERAPRGESRTA